MCDCILRFGAAPLSGVDRSGVGGGMPTSPHRGVQSDSSDKRLRWWVQRASEAPGGYTTTCPGTMPVAFARKARLLAIALLKGSLRVLRIRTAGPTKGSAFLEVLFFDFFRDFPSTRVFS